MGAEQGKEKPENYNEGCKKLSPKMQSKFRTSPDAGHRCFLFCTRRTKLQRDKPSREERRKCSLFAHTCKLFLCTRGEHRKEEKASVHTKDKNAMRSGGANASGGNHEEKNCSETERFGSEKEISQSKIDLEMKAGKLISVLNLEKDSCPCLQKPRANTKSNRSSDELDMSVLGSQGLASKSTILHKSVELPQESSLRESSLRESFLLESPLRENSLRHSSLKGSFALLESSDFRDGFALQESTRESITLQENIALQESIAFPDDVTSSSKAHDEGTRTAASTIEDEWLERMISDDILLEKNRLDVARDLQSPRFINLGSMIFADMNSRNQSCTPIDENKHSGNLTAEDDNKERVQKTSNASSSLTELPAMTEES